MRYPILLLVLAVLLGHPSTATSQDIASSTIPHEETVSAETELIIEQATSSSAVLFELTPAAVHADAGMFSPGEFVVLNGNRGFVWHAVGVSGTYDRFCMQLGSLGAPISIRDATVTVYARGKNMFPNGGVNVFVASSHPTDFSVAPIQDPSALPTQFQTYCLPFDQAVPIEADEVYAFAFDLHSSDPTGRYLNGAGYRSHMVTHQVYSGAINNPDIWAGSAMPFMLRTGDSAVPEPPVLSGSSNILFLPGLQGSRLYEKILGVERRRWELGIGMSQRDAQALYLDSEGSSEREIYTKEDAAIGRTDIPFAPFDIYRTFFEQLARLRQEGTIRNYLVFPYDWRANPIDVVEQGTSYEDGLHFVSEELKELAQASATGKVTIVGHSNGGLVAKALMQRLEREGQTNLVEAVVLVSVPQLGTPQAIAPMLHGDFGALTSFGGLYLNKTNARGLAEYMPDAYALLPAPAYFSHVGDAVIDLSEAPMLRALSGMGTANVVTSSDFGMFLTGAGVRPQPSVADVEMPNTLSRSLLGRAWDTHEELDAWKPPEGVRVVQVAGWGLDTARGISYAEHEESVCAIPVPACATVTKLTHRIDMTPDGDGTVVLPSQVMDPSWETYYLNLYEANKEGQWRRHADITESEAFQHLFEQIISTTSTATLPEHVSVAVPVPDPTDARLRLRVLSPVALHAYDAHGRHTGPAENPDPSSDLLYKEEQIPNSYYLEFGEGKYLGLPAGGEVLVTLNGLDNGTFTYEAETVSSAHTESIIFKDVPVASSTTARMRIENGELHAAVLSIDADGDGSVDMVLTGMDHKEVLPGHKEGNRSNNGKSKHGGHGLSTVLGTSTVHVDEHLGFWERLRILSPYLLSIKEYLEQGAFTPSQIQELYAAVSFLRTLLP